MEDSNDLDAVGIEIANDGNVLENMITYLSNVVARIHSSQCQSPAIIFNKKYYCIELNHVIIKINLIIPLFDRN